MTTICVQFVSIVAVFANFRVAADLLLLPYNNVTGLRFYHSGDDNSEEYILPEPVYLLGAPFSHLYVGENGVIGIGTPCNDYSPQSFPTHDSCPATPIIAPFWTDVDSTANPSGFISYYHIRTGHQYLNDLSNMLQKMEGLQPGFTPSIAFIATWYQITFSGGTGISPTNTFQCIIVSDGAKALTYVILHYQQLTWYSSIWTGGDPRTGLGGQPAIAGIAVGDNHYQELELSGTSGILNLTERTNFQPQLNPALGRISLHFTAIEERPPPALLKSLRDVVVGSYKCSASGDPHFHTFDTYSITTNPQSVDISLAAAPCSSTLGSPYHWSVWFETAPWCRGTAKGMSVIIVKFNNPTAKYVFRLALNEIGELDVTMNITVGETPYGPKDVSDLFETFDGSIKFTNFPVRSLPTTTSQQATFQYNDAEMILAITTNFPTPPTKCLPYFSFDIDLTGNIYQNNTVGHCGNNNNEPDEVNFSTGNEFRCLDPLNGRSCSTDEDYSSCADECWAFGSDVADNLYTNSNLFASGVLCSSSYYQRPSQKLLFKQTHKTAATTMPDGMHFGDTNNVCSKEVETLCGVMKDPKGPMAPCVKSQPDAMHAKYVSCVYDLCAMADDAKLPVDAACDFVAGAIAACKRLDPLLLAYEWRTETFCPLPCPVNSHYEPCGTACAPSCESLTSFLSCQAPCREGCFCDEGYVLQGNACVPLGNCGCLDTFGYNRAVGKAWVTNDCKQLCNCSSLLSISCNPVDPCDANAVCSVSANGTDVTCQCITGFSGDGYTCMKDPCSSSPCLRGACLNVGTNAYQCICPAAYTGPQCEHLIDYCSTNPCQNDGVCSSHTGGFECGCSPDFNGPVCQYGINWCQNAPCLNGGTCSSYPRNYQCRCMPGYNGTDCENRIDFCRGASCLNGATCNNLFTGYNCTCAYGFFGSHCESFDYCVNATCSNMATCVSGASGFMCTCPPGYTGTYCAKMSATSTTILPSSHMQSTVSLTSTQRQITTTVTQRRTSGKATGRTTGTPTPSVVPAESTTDHATKTIVINSQTTSALSVTCGEFSCNNLPDGYYSDPEYPCSGAYCACVDHQVSTMKCYPGLYFDARTTTCDYKQNVLACN